MSTRVTSLSISQKNNHGKCLNFSFTLIFFSFALIFLLHLISQKLYTVFVPGLHEVCSLNPIQARLSLPFKGKEI